MKKNIIIKIFMVLWFSSSYAQEYDKFINDFIWNRKLIKKNVVSEFKHFDLTNLLENGDNIGFKGKNKDLLYSSIVTAKKHPKSELEYIVEGQVKRKKGHLCTFGVVNILSIQKVERDKIKDSVLKGTRYLLKGTYTIYESNEHPLMGFNNKIEKGYYEGVFFIRFIVHDNKIISDYEDGFRKPLFTNNAYIGTFTRYNQRGKNVICNWGCCIPPLCGDLNIGETIFEINPKYKK